MKGMWLRILLLLLFVGVLAVGGGWWMLRGQEGAIAPPIQQTKATSVENTETEPIVDNPDSFTLPSVIEPFEAIPVSAKLTANIASLLVRDGSMVQKGQVLCVLEDTEIRKQIDAARLQLLQTQETLRSAMQNREISRQSKALQLNQAQQDLESAHVQNDLELQRVEEALRRAERQLADAQSLYQAKAISAEEVRGKQEVVNDAKRAVELTKTSQAAGIAARQKALEQAQLEAKNETVSAQDIQTYRLAVINAQEELAEREKRLKDTRIIAPIGGTVRIISRTRTSSMTATGQSAEVLGPGVRVYEGDPFLEIATTEQACCRIEVDETDIARLRIGMPAKITGDAFSGRELTGKIVTIQTSGRKAGEGVSLFPVTILITSSLQDIHMGMTADVTIDLSDDNPGRLSHE
ncbi:MAG: HlyD family efflux transporter periplasmic adaptor subunit [Dehalococcoidia bacterium]|nr:MAG: HlyD family efflux transporter periplasmic adaptor subunit [Dehalococcoidia bacterium]